MGRLVRVPDRVRDKLRENSSRCRSRVSGNPVLAGACAGLRSGARTTGRAIGRQLRSEQAGYTLIELITAMSIFSVVLVMSIGAFVSVSRSATKAGAQRAVQQDIRFNIEEISRQSRSAAIDYAFYKQNDGTACSLANQRTLAVLSTESVSGSPRTRRVIYHHDASVPEDPAIYRFEGAEGTAPNCAAIGRGQPGNQRVTADNLRVIEGRFIVSPDRDPYDPTTLAVSPAAPFIHPRVTIIATVRTAAGSSTEISRQGEVTIQTTVSARGYPVTEAGLVGHGTQPTPTPTPTPTPVPTPTPTPPSALGDWFAPGLQFNYCTKASDGNSDVCNYDAFHNEGRSFFVTSNRKCRGKGRRKRCDREYDYYNDANLGYSTLNPASSPNPLPAGRYRATLVYHSQGQVNDYRFPVYLRVWIYDPSGQTERKYTTKLVQLPIANSPNSGEAQLFIFDSDLVGNEALTMTEPGMFYIYFQTHNQSPYFTIDSVKVERIP